MHRIQGIHRNQGTPGMYHKPTPKRPIHRP